MAKSIIPPLILFSFFSIPCLAQMAGTTRLFQEKKTLPIRLSFSLKEVKKTTNDSIYFPSTLFYKNEKDSWDSIRIGLRARGNFRRKNCYFAPLRIKIQKNTVKGTLFEGNKSLKLVLPCQTAPNFNELIIKEYICYKLYESITPYTFNTRLLDITFSNQNGKQVKTFQMIGFFIEDDDLVAKRFHGKIIDDLSLHPLALDDTSAIRHDFFEYLIANTDWSATFHHNTKIVETTPRKYIPIAYDFDMSGFVNAPYATFRESLEIESVRERIFNGFCRNEHIAQWIRAEYIKNKPAILGVLDQYENYFVAKEFASLKKYLIEFFDILENEKKFKTNILLKCRTR